MSTAAAMTVDHGCDPDPQRHLHLGQDLLPDAEESRLSWQEGDGRKEGEGSGELRDTPLRGSCCWFGQPPIPVHIPELFPDSLSVSTYCLPGS